MRCGDHTGAASERWRWPLVGSLSDIHRQPTEPTRVESGSDSGFIEQLPARDVDKHGSRPHEVECGSVDQLLRRCRRSSERQHEVGPPQQRRQITLLDPVARHCHVGVAHDHTHPHLMKEASQVRADRAVADDARSATTQLPTLPLRRRTGASIVDSRFGHVAGKVEHQSQSELRCGGDEALVRMRDQHSRRACCRNIDRADVNGASQEGEQLGQLDEQSCTAWSRPVSDDHVALDRRCHQLVRVEITVERVEHHPGDRLQLRQCPRVVRIEVFRVVGEEHRQHRHDFTGRLRDDPTRTQQGRHPYQRGDFGGSGWIPSRPPGLTTPRIVTGTHHTQNRDRDSQHPESGQRGISDGCCREVCRRDRRTHNRGNRQADRRVTTDPHPTARHCRARQPALLLRAALVADPTVESWQISTTRSAVRLCQTGRPGRHRCLRTRLWGHVHVATLAAERTHMYIGLGTLLVIILLILFLT